MARQSNRPRCNLLVDGHMAASDRVTQILRTTGGPHMVTVSKDGRVSAIPRCKLTTADYTAWVQRDEYLGTYTRKVMQYELESDLHAREQELRAAMRKQKAA